ncbi:tyrosine-type recombinase/integrase [Leeuwenhoekiella sp. LLG6367-2.1]|uniref:tyrosine-type recombinase/integrase n=1 Tax=Leeuwenhoekiella sp. LLG6367-2.1 TaxID=3160833 RepID=UPI00386A6132
MSIKIVYRPVNKDDKDGYLKIRVIENRKTTFKTLGIKISGKNWLDDKQRVSKSESNADAINEKIQDVLRDLAKHDTPTQALKTTSKTILDFYDEVISTTLNNGTRLKYIDIRNRFKAYLKTEGHRDLRLSQLTPQYVNGFHTYIRNCGSAINTANYNLKSFKSIINKAVKSGLVNYTNDPFALLKMKYTQTANKTLTQDEVSRLIAKDKFVDHRKVRYNNLGVCIEEFRDIFLFQLFTQGLRCSDVQLLRWGDFKSVEGSLIMEYTQYKTKKKMRLRLTLIALKMLNSRLSKLDNTFSDKIQSLERKREIRLINLKKTEKELETQKSKKWVNDITIKYNENAGIQATSTEFEKLIERGSINERLATLQTTIKNIEADIYNLYIHTITEVADPSKFVFHFLDNDEFSYYKDGADLTDKQYTSLTGSRSYYNQILKKIAEQCDIATNLTSHVARHTYTQLLLNNNADLVAVSQSLGHSHIATTQAYIQQLPNNKLLDINEVLSNTFN